MMNGQLENILWEQNLDYEDSQFKCLDCEIYGDLARDSLTKMLKNAYVS